MRSAARGRFSCSTSPRELDAEYARQSIAALSAKGWILAIEARMQTGASRARCCARRSSLLALARDRLRVGIGGEYDVALAQANVDTFRDTARQLDSRVAAGAARARALVGRYPVGGGQVPRRAAARARPVPVGLPSELLERRPDVVAAERRVAAAFYRIEEPRPRACHASR